MRTSEVHAAQGDVRAAMDALVGESLQRPPAYSAVKVGGRKLYEAARAGTPLEAAPRPVTVAAFDLLGIAGRDADFRVVCSVEPTSASSLPTSVWRSGAART